MSQRLQKSLYNVASQISVTEMNKQAWLSYATTAQQSSMVIRKKTIIMVAAILTLLALAGFAFINSIYFDKIFGDPFSISSPDLSDSQLRELLKDLSPGDVLNAEIETDKGIVSIRAMRGDTLDYVVYGLKGEYNAHITTIPHNQSNLKSLIDLIGGMEGLEIDQTNSLESHISSGEFVAALDGGGHKLEYIILNDGKIDTLLYKGNAGETILISPVMDKLYMEVKTQESALVSDISVDGRTFTVIEHPESDQIDLYLYLNENSKVSSINLGNYDPTSSVFATKKQMLDAARHLVLYNENANIPIGDANQSGENGPAHYDEEFFQKINDPVIRGSANEIAAAVRGAKKDENTPQVIVWEKDGREVSVDFFSAEDDCSQHITIHFSEIEYSQTKKLIPLPEQAPFEQEDWFPADKLRSVNLFYNEGRLVSVFWSGKGLPYSMSMRYDGRKSFEGTSLDVLATSIYSTSDTLIKVVRGKGGSPYLIRSTERDGKLDIYITGAMSWEQKTLLYDLRIEESELPDGSVDKWIDAF